MTDFHSHILPGIDDGCQNLEESIDNLVAAKNAGVTHIMATPHFNCKKENILKFFKKRASALSKLSGKIEELSLPKITLGAEVAFCDELLELSQIEALAIEGTKYILIEMPYEGWTTFTLKNVFRMMSEHDLRPIIAHIERYPPRMMNMLLDMEVIAQVNAESVCHLPEYLKLHSFIKAKKIQLLGSDCHGDKRVYREFAKAHIKLIKRGIELNYNAERILQNRLIYTD